MLEWLKSILGDAYTEDIDKQVSGEIGKGFVAKADFKTKNEALKLAEEQIKAANNQIEAFKGKDIEAIEKEIEGYKVKVKEMEKAHKDELDKITYSSAAEKFIDGLKPKDDLSKKAILSEFMTKEFKLEGENFVGAKEWSDELTTKHAGHFAGSQLDGPKPGEVGGNQPDVNAAMIDAAFGLGGK